MSDTISGAILGAIIGGFFTLIGVFLTAYLQKRKGKPLKRNKNNNNILPVPFACTSRNGRGACHADDTYGLVFDFSIFDPLEATDFVSLVYQFPEPVNLETYRALTFDLTFDEGNVNRVDLEIKKDEEDHYRNPSCICRKTDAGHYVVNFKENVQSMEVLKLTRELCFVVKADYHDGDDKCKGQISIKNVAIE